MGPADTHAPDSAGRILAHAHYPFGLFGWINTGSNDAGSTDVQGFFDPDFFVRRYSNDTGTAVVDSLEKALGTLRVEGAVFGVYKEPVITDLGHNFSNFGCRNRNQGSN